METSEENIRANISILRSREAAARSKLKEIDARYTRDRAHYEALAASFLDRVAKLEARLSPAPAQRDTCPKCGKDFKDLARHVKRCKVEPDGEVAEDG